MAQKLTYVVLLLLLLQMVASTDPAHAGVFPDFINYQGRLTDASNNPITTPQTAIFRIYDALTGGNLKWTETQGVVPDFNGTFSVTLGTFTPLDLDIFGGLDPGFLPYLEVEVNGQIINPRTSIFAAFCQIKKTGRSILVIFGANNLFQEFKS